MVILSKFAENLSMLMQIHNLKAPALGEILGTHRTNITRYRQGKRLPSYHLFIKITEYFNVSADVLLGRTDYCGVEKFLPAEPFGTAFRRALNETHTSQYNLQQKLHYSSATTAAWLANERVPSMEHVCQLADYLDVTVDFLLGRIR